jgi:hypothetical protein
MMSSDYGSEHVEGHGLRPIGLAALARALDTSTGADSEGVTESEAVSLPPTKSAPTATLLSPAAMRSSASPGLMVRHDQPDVFPRSSRQAGRAGGTNGGESTPASGEPAPDADVPRPSSHVRPLRPRITTSTIFEPVQIRAPGSLPPRLSTRPPNRLRMCLSKPCRACPVRNAAAPCPMWLDEPEPAVGPRPLPPNLGVGGKLPVRVPPGAICFGPEFHASHLGRPATAPNATRSTSRRFGRPNQRRQTGCGSSTSGAGNGYVVATVCRVQWRRQRCGTNHRAHGRTCRFVHHGAFSRPARSRESNAIPRHFRRVVLRTLVRVARCDWQRRCFASRAARYIDSFGRSLLGSSRARRESNVSSRRKSWARCSSTTTCPFDKLRAVQPHICSLPCMTPQTPCFPCSNKPLEHRTMVQVGACLPSIRWVNSPCLRHFLHSSPSLAIQSKTSPMRFIARSCRSPVRTTVAMRGAGSIGLPRMLRVIVSSGSWMHSCTIRLKCDVSRPMLSLPSLGGDLGYDPYESRDERASAHVRYLLWWEQEGRTHFAQ